MSEPLSLSPQEAAEYIGLSVPTIYRLLSAGAIKGKRSGARTLINGPSIRAYYAALPDYVPGSSIPNAPQLQRPSPGKAPDKSGERRAARQEVRS